jgi:hypothetical protein
VIDVFESGADCLVSFGETLGDKCAQSAFASTGIDERDDMGETPFTSDS